MFIFRFNVTKNFASGHLFRAISLKKIFDIEFPDKKSIFLIFADEFIENYRNLLRNFNHIIYTNTDEEFKILDSLKSSGYDFLLLDIKDTTTEYTKKLKQLNFKIIGFDDTDAGAANLDILIDANIHNQQITENRLFGAEYILLDPVFSEYNKKLKIINDRIQTILLFFGGADSATITDFIFNNFTKINFNNCNITILTKKIFASANYNNINFIDKTLTAKEMSKLYFNNDLTIISGGISLYESMCVGCPAIIINQNEEQYTNTKYYNNFIINTGIFNKNNTLEKLNSAFSAMISEQKRKLLSAQSKKKIDGLGYLRIINAIKKLTGY